MKKYLCHPQKGLHILGRILTYVFLIVLMLLAIEPFSWVLLSSFKNNAEIINTSLALPKSFSFRNYAKAFEMAPLASFYVHSILIAIFGTLFNLTVVGMAAYVISRFRFRFKGVVIALISALMMVPGAALLQPLYLTAKNLGFYDKLYGLMIVYAAFGAPPVSLHTFQLLPHHPTGNGGSRLPGWRFFYPDLSPGHPAHGKAWIRHRRCTAVSFMLE